MVNKFFSPKEINKILPDIKNIVEEIISEGQNARLLLTFPDPFKEHQRKLIDVEQRIKSLIEQLENKGCYYKDWNFEIGLVDFPAIINGQEALLCWRSDETEIGWFHGYEDGYAGRRPVTKELIFS